MDTGPRLRGPVTRYLLVAGGVVVLAHGIAAAALVLLQQSYADEVVPGVTVAGEPVGGLDARGVEDAVEGRAASLLAAPVEVGSCGDAAATTRGDAGITADVDGAVAEAWAIGRHGLWSALSQQIGVRSGRSFEVPLDREIDAARLERWAEQTARGASCQPQPAEIELEPLAPPDGAQVLVRPGEPGLDVRPAALVRAVEADVDGDGMLRIDTSAATIDPPTSDAELDAAVQRAERAVAAPVRLTNPSDGDDVELTPAALATILEVTFDASAPAGGRLELTADPRRLSEQLADDLDDIEVPPTDATLDVVDDELVVEDGVPGFTVDAESTAATLVELATRPTGRTGELAGTPLRPEFTRADVRALGIEQEVSSFTTDLVPGQPRNQNIQQAADYLDGSLVLPGEQLSLNEAVGRRTAERGFEENGFIRQGVVVSVYGGGVSQLATTFMNAAWFAGIELVDFQPHSLYFARYPVGREATLSWGTIDVVIGNDSPHAILVATSHSEREVTVSFWSTPWAKVDTWTGERTNPVPGALRDGFDIRFGRIITYPDGSQADEDYFHRYLPEDDPMDTEAPD